ncbi:transglycosylase SLT domain-containing protein [Streptomyces mayteni]
MPAIKTTVATALRRPPARVACLAAASAAVAVSLTLPANAADTGSEATASTQQVSQQANEAQTATTSDTPSADTGSKPVDDPGRGAQYDDNGRLIPIDRAEQPKAKPASDQQIDEWINDALQVMHENDIPGTYDGIYKNLMRESSGDPYTINMWDTNAQENIPSKGLLQVIDPTFDQYHVDGTKKDVYDPVANIVAACNYAADRYGSMDNVNHAY